MAADPDILTDFILPQNLTTPNASFFTFTDLRSYFTSGVILAPTNFTVIKATMAEFPTLNGQSVSSAYLIFPAGTANPPHTHPRSSTMAEFPALNGQSVSSAYLTFPAGTANPPHTHPRSSELMFLVQGSLEVGFVDTTNRLYTQTLQIGDMFVFPKGLVHFPFNNLSGDKFSIAVSGFGSSNPGGGGGGVSLREALFGGEIDNALLAKSFKTDVGTIQVIKAALKG